MNNLSGSCSNQNPAHAYMDEESYALSKMQLLLTFIGAVVLALVSLLTIYNCNKYQQSKYQV